MTMTSFCFVDVTAAMDAAFQTALKYHPREERGNTRLYMVKDEGGGACFCAHIFKKLADGFMKVSTSQHHEGL